jgi:ABC-type transporter Mla MlaB component
LTRLAQLEFDERDGVLVAQVSGELDLSGLQHLDSAGVRMLYDLRGRLAAARQRFAVVVEPGAMIREVLILAAVPATIRVHDEVDAAVTDVGHR